MAGAFSTAYSNAFDSGGGIAFDAATNSGYQSAASTYNWSHTCTGADRYLVVGIAMLSLAQTVTGITYNSVAMSLIGVRSSISGACRIELWGLVVPATGSNTIAVTLSGAIASAGCATSFTGVHQTSPIEGFNSAQATNVGAADATVDVTTVADNDWVVDIIATDDAAITVGSGQTSRNNVTGAGGSGAQSTEGPKTPAGSVTMSWTDVGALATWSIGAVALRPVAAASLFTGETFLVVETVTIDKWFRPPLHPIKHRRHQPDSASVSGIDPSLLESATQVFWFQPQSTPQPIAKRRPWRDSYTAGPDESTFGVAEVVTLDKWFREQQSPVPHKRFVAPSVLVRGIDPLLLDATTLLLWFQQQRDAQPIRKRKPWLDQWATGLDDTTFAVIVEDGFAGEFFYASDNGRDYVAATDGRSVPISASGRSLTASDNGRGYVATADGREMLVGDP